MIQLDLNDAELQVLIEVLESAHSDLRMEIADTDSKDFRDMLHGRKAVLAKVLNTLKEGTATSTFG
ncbi:MAG: hypothetical protein JSU87_06520 [Gemmatimonadota bacterium]|nr:MAG: hypothetical protein JSU87_06520 [Gemmatimonadota bacterium]